MFLIPLLVLLLPAVVFRLKRLKPLASMAWAPFSPYVAWLGTSLVGSGVLRRSGGTLSNLFLEPLVVGAASGVTFAVLALAPVSSARGVLRRCWAATAATVLVGIGVACLTPNIPE